MKRNCKLVFPDPLPNKKSCESLNPGLIPVQTVVDEGGLGKMWKLFGDKTEELINELNNELAA